jgi:hypothetical protein
MLKTNEMDVNKGAYNILAFNLKGKMVKKSFKHKYEVTSKRKAQVVISSAFNQ